MTVTVGGTSITYNDSTAQGTAYLGGRGQVFSTAGSGQTFTIPTGVTALKVTVVGGGGSAKGANGGCACAPVSGNSGGTSSVASGTQTISTVSATGGAGCNFSSNTAAGGAGSGGDINAKGGFVGQSSGGIGFSSVSAPGLNSAGTLGAGGQSDNSIFGGGGGGGTAIKFLTGLTPGNTLAVTVGAGGAQVGSTVVGKAGGAGIVIFEW